MSDPIVLIGRLACFYFTDGGYDAEGGFKPCVTVTLNADRIEDLIARKLDFPSDGEVQPLLLQTSNLIREAGAPSIVRDEGKFLRVTVEEITEAEAYQSGWNEKDCCGDDA